MSGDGSVVWAKELSPTCHDGTPVRLRTRYDFENALIAHRGANQFLFFGLQAIWVCNGVHISSAARESDRVIRGWPLKP
jgi:hypothetical protein